MEEETIRLNHALTKVQQLTVKKPNYLLVPKEIFDAFIRPVLRARSDQMDKVDSNDNITTVAIPVHDVTSDQAVDYVFDLKFKRTSKMGKSGRTYSWIRNFKKGWTEFVRQHNLLMESEVEMRWDPVEFRLRVRVSRDGPPPPVVLLPPPEPVVPQPEPEPEVGREVYAPAVPSEAGALELVEKTVSDAMISIVDTLAIDYSSVLDRAAMTSIMKSDHGRGVLVYHEERSNVIGVILVKSLLSINPDDEMPVKSVKVYKIPRVIETMPLFDLLKEFKKAHCYMALVLASGNPEDAGSIEEERSLQQKRIFYKSKSCDKTKNWKRENYSDVLGTELPKPEEAIGVICLEDVLEVLLKED